MPEQPKPIIGLSWFAVEQISNLPFVTHSHAQPDPNLVIAAFANSTLKLSKEPNALFIASANSPFGKPPAFGAIVFQNIV